MKRQLERNDEGLAGPSLPFHHSLVIRASPFVITVLQGPVSAHQIAGKREAI
jgi:hypothetical protein